MGRTPCCDKNGLKKGPWTSDEDQKLMDYIHKHGHGNWRTLPKNAGLERCGKSCRLRWTNYLRPDIKRGRFSFEEEEIIVQLHSILGNKWSAIAARLPGRTDNEIKNYWNTHIRKRLLRMGIDPVTHTPRLHLSSILSNYNSNISHYNLINPELLRLLSSHHQSTTALPQTQFLNHPQQNPSSQQDFVTLDNYVPATSDYCNYSAQPIMDDFLFYSTDSNNLSAPSSPTPLNSTNSTYADDHGETISYCTDFLNFDIPNILDVSNFDCNF